MEVATREQDSPVRLGKRERDRSGEIVARGLRGGPARHDAGHYDVWYNLPDTLMASLSCVQTIPP